MSRFYSITSSARASTDGGSGAAYPFLDGVADNLEVASQRRDNDGNPREVISGQPSTFGKRGASRLWLERHYEGKH
jgi:hypothetical protein